jgi:hypothetical protein
LDIHCLAKHRHRLRPDQAELLAQRPEARRPWWINLHRFFAVPLRHLRRRLLVAMGIRAASGKASSETYAEDAYRHDRRAA